MAIHCFNISPLLNLLLMFFLGLIALCQTLLSLIKSFSLLRNLSMMLMLSTYKQVWGLIVYLFYLGWFYLCCARYSFQCSLLLYSLDSPICQLYHFMSIAYIFCLFTVASDIFWYVNWANDGDKATSRLLSISLRAKKQFFFSRYEPMLNIMLRSKKPLRFYGSNISSNIWAFFSQLTRATLHYDNWSVIWIASNTDFHEKTKYIKIDCHSTCHHYLTWMILRWRTDPKTLVFNFGG